MNADRWRENKAIARSSQWRNAASARYVRQATTKDDHSCAHRARMPPSLTVQPLGLLAGSRVGGPCHHDRCLPSPVLSSAPPCARLFSASRAAIRPLEQLDIRSGRAAGGQERGQESGGNPLTRVAGDPRAPADLCFVHGRCLCPAAPAVGVSPSRCERCLLPSGGRTAWRPPTSPGPAARRHPARYGRP